MSLCWLCLYRRDWTFTRWFLAGSRVGYRRLETTLACSWGQKLSNGGKALLGCFGFLFCFVISVVSQSCLAVPGFLARWSYLCEKWRRRNVPPVLENPPVACAVVDTIALPSAAFRCYFCQSSAFTFQVWVGCFFSFGSVKKIPICHWGNDNVRTSILNVSFLLQVCQSVSPPVLGKCHRVMWPRACVRVRL